MFVLIIEKRISAKADAVDWYVLLACVLPFPPTEGLEIQLEKQLFVKLERVVYNPTNASFWGQTKPLLHPKPNAEAVAKKLVVTEGWDRTVIEKDLEAAKDLLHKEGLRKLQQLIIQAQTKAAMARGQLSNLLRGPGGPRRHKS